MNQIFTVPGISCDHCKRTIEGAVAALPGIHSVRVDVATRTVSVDFDVSATTSEQVVETIEEEGYEVAP